MHRGWPMRTYRSWNARNRRTLRPLSSAPAGTGQGAVSGTLRAVVADRRLPAPRTLRADRRLQTARRDARAAALVAFFLPACWRPTCRIVADYDAERAPWPFIRLRAGNSSPDGNRGPEPALRLHTRLQLLSARVKSLRHDICCEV